MNGEFKDADRIGEECVELCDCGGVTAPVQALRDFCLVCHPHFSFLFHMLTVQGIRDLNIDVGLLTPSLKSTRHSNLLP